MDTEGQGICRIELRVDLGFARALSGCVCEIGFVRRRLLRGGGSGGRRHRKLGAGKGMVIDCWGVGFSNQITLGRASGKIEPRRKDVQFDSQREARGNNQDVKPNSQKECQE